MYLDTFKEFPIIETKRLVLRQMKNSDVDDIYEYAKDKEAFQYTEGFPSDYDSVMKAIKMWNNEAYKSETFIRWAVELKEESKVIGGIYLFLPVGDDTIGRRMDIGYDYSRNYWGKGYASEAIKAVTIHGFTNMKLVRVQAQIVPQHIGSIRACEKAGYVDEGILRNYCPYRHGNAGMKTMKIMGCIPSDYNL